MAQSDGEFDALAISLAFPAAFTKFLKDKGIADAESVALMASDEKELHRDIFDVAKAAGVDITQLNEKIAIKKLWIRCRKSLDTGSLSASTPAEKVEEGIPKEHAKNIKSLWERTHGFSLPDSWLLNAAGQRKLWNDFNNSPPKIELMLMESIRLASSFLRTSGTTFSVVPGKNVSASAEVADNVHAQVEVFTRARAWFLTIAYITIGRNGFLTLQTAIFASEKIMSLCLRTRKGVAPPIHFLVTAWAATISHFSEQVRIQNPTTLDALVHNTGAWEHFWDNPPVESSGSENHSVPDTKVDLPPDVVLEMTRLKHEARQLQSANDRLRTDNERISGEWRGKGAKGKGKDKGKGGKYFNNRDGGQGNRDRDRERSRDRRSGRDRR